MNSSPLLNDLVGDGDGLAKLQFGLYYYAKIQGINEETEDQNLFAVTQSCVGYGSDVSFDAAWNTARAFAMIAPILGGILAVGLYVSPCCIFFTRGTWNKIAFMYLLVVPAFQSLTLLILASDACKNNPVIENLLDQWIKVLGIDSSASDSSSTSSAATSSANSTSFGNTTSAASADVATNSTTMIGSETETALMSVYGDECSWDWGTYVNLASMILFFLTGIAMLAMGAPTRPDPKEPEVQTVTYQQTTDGNGEPVVEEVDVTTDTAQPGGPAWADTTHSSAKLY